VGVEGDIGLKPLTCNAEEVRAIQNGATVLMRPVKPQPQRDETWGWSIERDKPFWIPSDTEKSGRSICSVFKTNILEALTTTLTWMCPYPVGSELWVRETWEGELYGKPIYKADYEPYKAFTGEYPLGRPDKWRSPVMMPRWASRFTLVVTGVECKQAMDITEKEARALGAEQCPYADGKVWSPPGGCSCYLQEPEPRPFACSLFAEWDSLFPAYPWESNPWLWCYQVEPEEGAK